MESFVYRYGIILSRHRLNNCALLRIDVRMINKRIMVGHKNDRKGELNVN